MKRIGTVLTIVFFLVAIVISFFAGDYMSDKEHLENNVQRCSKHISFAIDTVENKGLSVEGAAETIASNIWVAHELCNDPEISAELSNLWNTLVYDKDAYSGQEDALATQLKDILKRFQ